MTVSSVSELVEAFERMQLLQPGQIEAITEHLLDEVDDARILADVLADKGWLTHFQVDQLFREKPTELVLGPYVLLEKLGEGGMGEVFKARHKVLDRKVALKVIRQQHLDHEPEAKRRFQREARAAALLSHPNVVTVYDSDQVGSTCYIAMEFLDGVDLSRMVKDQGPLPIEVACDYIRQAALGLDHAHGHGIIHRDIKPSNLYSTSVPGSPEQENKKPDHSTKPEKSDDDSDDSATTLASRRMARVRRNMIRPATAAPVPEEKKYKNQAVLIKILDMGLVRITNPADVRNTSNSLTQEGSMVGTPDYIAPEQARNAHRVDIRADLYSLGCTFYYLLVGRPPFTQGSAIEKLLMHQLDEPRPVQELRPEVPPGVAAVVKKLMSKRPMDRYQTPAEVVQAITALKVDGKPAPVSAPPPAPSAVRQATPPLSPLTPDDHVTPPVRVQPGAEIPTKPSKPVEAPGWISKTRKPEPKEEAKPASPAGETDSAKLIAKLKGHSGCITCLEFSPDRNLLASGGVDARVRIWDFSANKPRERAAIASHLEAVHSVTFSPDGKRLATGSGAMDGNIGLWDLQQEYPVGISALQGHQGPVNALAFSADGKFLASGSSDCTVRIWDVAIDRRCKATLKGHPDGVKAVAYTPDGRSLASGGEDGSIRIWNIGRSLWSKARAVLTGHDGPINSLAYAPNGLTLASVSPDQSVRIWDVARVEPAELMVLSGHSSVVRQLKFAPDSRSLVTIADDRQVILWELPSGKNLKTYYLPNSIVTSASFTLDARYLAAGTSDGPIMVYRLGDKRRSYPNPDSQ